VDRRGGGWAVAGRDRMDVRAHSGKDEHPPGQAQGRYRAGRGQVPDQGQGTRRVERTGGRAADVERTWCAAHRHGGRPETRPYRALSLPTPTPL